MAIEIDVFNDDAQKIHRLEAQGFSFLAHFENKRIYDLEQVELGYTLEPGFTIQRFSASRDFAGRVALVRSAFGNTRYTEANIQGLMASPDYIDEYNLSVVAPDGQQVAYCIGWHDRSKAQAGYIEPVGTHAAFRRRGFAKAINRECFRRMKANGIKTVEIASRAEPDVANFLYNALGPASKRRFTSMGNRCPRHDELYQCCHTMRTGGWMALTFDHEQFTTDWGGSIRWDEIVALHVDQCAAGERTLAILAFEHRNGGVIEVNLDEEIADETRRQLADHLPLPADWQAQVAALPPGAGLTLFQR
ncbi:MAG: GNAT family N-acetyltransferase [Caldilineaceae bacterium]